MLSGRYTSLSQKSKQTNFGNWKQLRQMKTFTLWFALFTFPSRCRIPALFYDQTSLISAHVFGLLNLSTIFIPFLNVHFWDELLTTYGATASLRNDRIFTGCSRTSKEFWDSFTASVEMPPQRAVLKRVVRPIHFVTLSGVVYVTVVKRCVTGALIRHTIYTTHLRMKGRVKNLNSI